MCGSSGRVLSGTSFTGRAFEGSLDEVDSSWCGLLGCAVLTEGSGSSGLGSCGKSCVS